ncbi:uncharacterized protein LOC131956466 [Physella acuta]|uniref:uncharacterized protein LOC131956466 n=1 Tax=Physella acuta TaxID=109671 RepID=UPI0027DAD3A8|nr:uncharacterized protein LOC131956466 [Physella acuta]XP_059176900.1 uncharacterized protein LOC131956466 [Physella acuta]
MDDLNEENAFRGTHEVDDSGEGCPHVLDCTKNPNHENFIPIDEFNIGHLPARYQDQDMLDVIRTQADLTVMVTVNSTSPRRPDFYLGVDLTSKNSSYPATRSGTGRVRGGYECVGQGHCVCVNCEHSKHPSLKWGKIRVLTATHVVFDESEAINTTCVLGFNNSSSCVTKLKVCDMSKADVKGDLARLTCVTCDMDLINSLNETVSRFYNLCNVVNKKYHRFVNLDKLIVIVSHPHRWPKHVSVGQWITRQERTDEHDRSLKWTKYTYTACTCPGSSGAPVYKLGTDRFYYFHPHSGTNSNVNFSGEGWE